MAPPTAIPPRIRDRTNTEKSPVVAESSAETVNSNAVSIRTFFRPKASLKKPASAFPPSAPQPRQLTAQPSFRSPLVPASVKYFLMNGTAPEITVASKPKRNPPTATISATDTVYNLPSFIMRIIPLVPWRLPVVQFLSGGRNRRIAGYRRDGFSIGIHGKDIIEIIS